MLGDEPSLQHNIIWTQKKKVNLFTQETTMSKARAWPLICIRPLQNSSLFQQNKNMHLGLSQHVGLYSLFELLETQKKIWLNPSQGFCDGDLPIVIALGQNLKERPAITDRHFLGQDGAAYWFRIETGNCELEKGWLQTWLALSFQSLVYRVCEWKGFQFERYAVCLRFVSIIAWAYVLSRLGILKQPSAHCQLALSCARACRKPPVSICSPISLCICNIHMWHKMECQTVSDYHAYK